MSDDLVKRLQAACHDPEGEPLDQEGCGGAVQSNATVADVEEAIIEIARLRAAINDALTAPWPDPELNSTRHQEPIGPNETSEEAIKRLVSVRAQWAVCENDRNNPLIADLRAELATARRDGMKDAAKWHEVRAMELSGKAGLARNFRQLLRQSDFHTESAATIRAAAGEGK